MAICNQCGGQIAWRQNGGKYTPINPLTRADHRFQCHAAGKRSVLIVIDTETTGLKPELGHEAVQIAGVALDAKTLETVGEYSSWMAPNHPEDADPRALATHGRSLDWLATQPDSDVVRRAFMAWVGQYAFRPIPVGYNLPFDLMFLETWDIAWNHCQIDVMQLVGLHLWRTGHVADRKLGTAAAKLGIPLQAHDALEDARATAELLRRFSGVFVRGLQQSQPA